MKKVMLSKSVNANAIKIIVPRDNAATATATATATTAPNDESEVFSKRKSMQRAYSDLFRALLQLPDKEVQHRVLEAINGTSSQPSTTTTTTNCPRCGLKSEVTTSNVGTQTGENFHVSTIQFTRTKQASKSNSTTTSDDNPETPPTIASPQQQTTTQLEENSPASQTIAKMANQLPPRKRRRRRKICLPQVVKKSHAQMAQVHLQPKMQKRKVVASDSSRPASPSTIVGSTINASTAAKRQRCDSIGLFINLDDYGSDNCLPLLFSTPSPLDFQMPENEETILRTIAEEFLTAETAQPDGLLPLHHAITNNELNILKRQIFVWKKIKNTDLNELFTDDDQDCLQLAVVNDCFPKIIEVLLDAGLSTVALDNHSNTCIHLALLNQIDLDSLRLLMNRIDLNILLKLNDDGHTPLHIAIRHDRFLHAEILLNVLDERLGGSTAAATYQRKMPMPKEDKDANDQGRKEFLEFYDDACQQLELKYGTSIAKPKLKKKFLEAGEMRSGSTALFLAVENNMEHLVYLLLAHLTDPLVKNHAGQDAKSYFTEFSKILNLSLKLDNAMETVIRLIN